MLSERMDSHYIFSVNPFPHKHREVGDSGSKVVRRPFQKHRNPLKEVQSLKACGLLDSPEAKALKEKILHERGSTGN